MEVSDFINQPGMNGIIQEAQFLKFSDKRISDIIDTDGLQYIDLVMLGNVPNDYALIGFCFVLEEAGIRFYNLAGIGGASLHGLFYAMVGSPDQHKSIKLLKGISKHNIRVKSKPFQWFLNSSTQSEISSQNFKKWINDIFRNEGIDSIQELLSTNKLYNLKHRNGDKLSSSPIISIFSTDITSHSLVEFPKMANLYWNNPHELSPADLLELCISSPNIPGHIKLKTTPNVGKPQMEKLANNNSLSENHSNEVSFAPHPFPELLPLNLFHKFDKVPTKPTFGVVSNSILESGKYEPKLLSQNCLLRSKQIESVRNLMDQPDYSQLICSIGNNITCHLTKVADDEKLKQFKIGSEAAIDFLNDFNWRSYKNSRNSLNTVGAEVKAKSLVKVL